MRLDALARALRSVIPDPFVIAIGLTVVALVAAMVNGVVLGERTPDDLLQAWVNGWRPPGAEVGKPLGGLWSLLTFAMQMCLILVTGYVVAATRPVQAALRWLSARPADTRQAVVLISVVAMLLALLNWGLGLIAGALLAREVGHAMRDRGLAVHYPLLAASGYTGLAVWHGGFSGSAPLKVTSAASLDEVLGSALASSLDVIPLTQTVLSPRNLLINLALLVVVPAVMVLLVPRDASSYQAPPSRLQVQVDEGDEAAPGLAGWLERSPMMSWALSVLALAWIGPWAWDGGLLSLTPDSMNLMMLTAGLVLAGGPSRYMRLAQDGAAACAGIIVQFPLYGGILGLLAAGGLVDLLAGWMPTTAWGLSLTTLLSAGLVNLFVPSGGGQWTVQGPIVMQAAVSAGIDPGRIVLALSYGDAWTNLFQPFWALPLLGITGTRAGDILGPTFVLGIAVGMVYAIGVVAG